VVTLSLGGLLPGRVTAEPPPELSLSLAEALALASSTNPALAAARLRRFVNLAAVDVAGERPNPDLTFEWSRETPRQALGLAFPFETGGKRARRIEVAQTGVESGDAEIARVEVALRALVRRTYYALAADERRAEAAEELRGLSERARDAARERFEAGAVPRLELLQTELALAATENEAAAARSQLAAARAELNTVLARPPDAPIRATSDLDSGTVPDPEAATSLALSASADLVALDRMIDEGLARARLAYTLRYPDPVVAGGVTYDAQPEFDVGWRVAAAVTLPILTLHRAAVTLEENSVAQLRAERDATASQVRGAVFAAAAVASAARQQYLRYREQILPQAIEVEQMAEESYRAGQTNLVALLQSLQSARDLRTRSVQAGYEYQLALAELERAMGAPLP
jgi:cobalt-zinc-cadmium efflux system outer membrane protein